MAPHSQLHSPSFTWMGHWKDRLIGGGQPPNSGEGMKGGAGSKAHLVSGGVPEVLEASGPTWPPAIVAGSDPWPREALAGGAGALTGAGLVFSALEGLAAGEERKEVALRLGTCGWRSGPHPTPAWASPACRGCTRPSSSSSQSVFSSREGSRGGFWGKGSFQGRALWV